MAHAFPRTHAPANAFDLEQSSLLQSLLTASAIAEINAMNTNSMIVNHAYVISLFPREMFPAGALLLPCIGLLRYWQEKEKGDFWRDSFLALRSAAPSFAPPHL